MINNKNNITINSSKSGLENLSSRRILIHIPCYKRIDCTLVAVKKLVESFAASIPTNKSFYLRVVITFTGSVSDFTMLSKILREQDPPHQIEINVFYNGELLDAISNWNRFAGYLSGCQYYIPHHVDNYLDIEFFSMLQQILVDDLTVVVPSQNALGKGELIKIRQEKTFFNASMLELGVLIGKFHIPVECVYPVKIISENKIVYKTLGPIAWASDLLFFLTVSRLSKRVILSKKVITNFTLASPGGITATVTKPARREATIAAALASAKDGRFIWVIIFLKQWIRCLI